MIFREACYYVSEEKVNGYKAAAKCSLLASGAHLAIAMTNAELNTLKDTTPNYELWLGNRLIKNVA